MRRALAVFVLLGAFLLGAAPASATPITGLTVNNTSPSNGAGARTQYVVNFTTSTTAATLDAATGSITVTFPAGTTFGNFGGGDVFVGATRVGSCTTPNPSTTCSLFGANVIPASTGVRLEFDGITNPAAGNYTLTASTSSDTTVVTSSSYAVAAAHVLSGITVANGSPSNGAGARTHYTVPFTTSSTGGLSTTANSTILVTFPTGTTFGNFAGGDVFNAAGTRIGSCTTPSPSTLQSTCSLFGTNSIAANTTARLEFSGITNPGTPATNYTLTVATSSDTSPISSSNYTVADAHALSGITVANGSPSNGAGARTHYTVPFTTSTTGGLSTTANSTITLTFPNGTTFGSFGGGDVFLGPTRIGSCTTPSATTLQSTCSLFGTNSIPASTTATLEFTGITNPSTPGNYTLTVSTSSDTSSVTSATYAVAAANPLSGITVTNGSPSNGAGARTHYTVPFTTSATGGLSTSANSTILATFPTGTTFGNFGGGDVFLAATRIGSCTTPSPTTRQTTCSLFGTNSIAANTAARLEFTGITNPTAGNYTLTVSTSSDPSTVTSASYSVAAANTLTNLSAAPASSAQSATTSYTATFTTSATGGLSTTAVSTITLTFPAGTTFANFAGGDVFLASTRIGSCTTPNATTRQTTCSLFGTNSIGPNATARLVFTGITNPSTTGNYALTVATSSDTGTVTSSQYGIATDAAAPDTSIVSGPPATTTNAQPAFAFSSTEPGSTFQCRIDGAAFAACTSPFVSPPLAAGVHTFSVRSIDPAGNPDSTPASQTFTITTTQPSQPPAPTAGKTVVVSEAAGTVLVKAKGSNKFVALNADEGIPLGSTVDTTHGTVELTSQQKGGASQTAKFFDGIFLVTQQGSTINLKLTQKLAKCASGKASAAKKKPRKRRLWGDGKGHFRTQGKHSAATVVGTKWLVQDSCAGTLTKVARGVVSVRDFGKKKTIKVKAGKKYLAKP